MVSKRTGRSGHTGSTDGGNVRDVKIDRIGPVTIYKRGRSYYLYYRENRKTHRKRVDGNLAVAKATALKVAASIGENQPSPISFNATDPKAMVEQYLDFVEKVQDLAWRTQDRYRAALDRLLEYCKDAGVSTVDRFSEQDVEDFVRWLRGQTRTRNGAVKGKREGYKVGGIKFILSTCRTVFNWAGRRRMLPPYAQNPFSRFPIEQLRDSDAEDEGAKIFTAEQEKRFFAECSEWQRRIFVTLAMYGMRVGELTNLLIEDVDFVEGTIHIRSKPELFWRVKTARRRVLPLAKQSTELLRDLIGDRCAGFVFLNEQEACGRRALPKVFSSDSAFKRWLSQMVQDESDAKSRRRLVTSFCRRMGQIPVKRVQSEFCKITKKIGCPEFTRTHDLRHLFSSRAQEQGLNPLLVQDLLGHASLNMTRRYTHVGIEAKRSLLDQLKLGKGETDERDRSGTHEPERDGGDVESDRGGSPAERLRNEI